MGTSASCTGRQNRGAAPTLHALDRFRRTGGGATEAYFQDSSNAQARRDIGRRAFEQFHERERGEMVITITINEPTHDAALADTFSHTINAADVTIDGTIYEKGTLKLSPIQATKVTETIEQGETSMEFTYYRRTYTLKARNQGWIDKPVDVGTYELVGDLATSFKQKPIVDAAQLPVKRPYPLDGEGKRMPSVTDAPAELEFWPYLEKDWTSLAFTWSETWQ